MAKRKNQGAGENKVPQIIPSLIAEPAPFLIFQGYTFYDLGQFERWATHRMEWLYLTVAIKRGEYDSTDLYIQYRVAVSSAWQVWGKWAESAPATNTFGSKQRDYIAPLNGLLL
jgi:hypothetical protein